MNDLMLYCVFQACEEFRVINRKLDEQPNSIEELADQREWMKQIPEQLKLHEVKRYYLLKFILARFLIMLLNSLKYTIEIAKPGIVDHYFCLCHHLIYCIFN